MMNQMLITFGMAMLCTFTTVSGQVQIAKLGLSDLFVNTINLEYEYAFAPKASGLLEVGFQLSSDIPNIIITESIEAGKEKERNIRFHTASYTNFSIAGSYRIYTGEKALRGFYFGPYMRYSKYTVDISGLYNNNDFNLQDIEASVDGGVNIFSAGAEIGYQWIINDQISIGWNIIGVGTTFNNVDLSFTSNDADVFESWEDDIQNFLDDLPSGLGDSFSIDANNSTNTIKAKANFPLVSLRGSVSLGYAF